MTTIIDGSAGITFPNSTVQASAGVVLQVVQSTYSTSASTTSTTPAATGLTASITPKFSTSKILIIATIQGIQKGLGNIATGGMFSLYKNGSALATNYAQYVGYTNTSSINLPGGNTTNYLDSPATTSSTTYAIYFASSVSGQQVIAQADADLSTITLMEIAG
jgi:hypothetical protein